MSCIPEARDIVLQVAEGLQHRYPAAHSELLRAVRLMHREPMAKPRAAARYACPAEVAEEIRAYMRANPSAQTIDVAVLFCVGVGRVSEAINGKR